MTGPVLESDEEALKMRINGWKREGCTIGFVPTMGALHVGHVALVEAARAQCDKVAVSIFVNPAQFGPNEDYSRYPRTLEADLESLRQHRADLVFLPRAEAIYPPDFETSVSMGKRAEVLCGAHRPGHFDGVATVVTILLGIVQPDKAFFGEKDYQQLSIISQVAQDLRLPGEIIGVPTVRDADGLALSSRNRYLSSEERIVAPRLYAALVSLKAWLGGQPETTVQAKLETIKNELLAAGFTKIDYVEIRHAGTLDLPCAPVTSWSKYRAFAAAWLDRTRLIDNIAL